MKHFTIHIFGYGETQINGDDFSVKVKTDTLKKVQPLIDAIWALKPAESQAEKEFHAINIFSYEDFRYMSKGGFADKLTNDSKVLIDDLIEELKVAFDALPKNEEHKLFNQPANTVTPPATATDTSSTTGTGTDTSATTGSTTTPADEIVTPPAPNTDAPTS
jgi:hypothetical protein